MPNEGFDLLLVLGGLGMFLLGMHIMTAGLRSMAGDALGRALRKSTDSPLSGAIVGTVTTALIQSSSATTVAAVGFVSAGVLSFPQALGIIFGANVGTTITGWIVALLGFKLALGRIALPLIFFGVVLRMVRSDARGNLGLAIAGFGLIFVGISNLQQGFGFLTELIDPSWLPDPGWVGRFAMAGLGFALTAITQSSSAGVAFALAAVHSGAIPLEHAAAAVIGMDLGSSATALIASLGARTQGRRTGAAHFVFNLFTAGMAMFLLEPYLWAIGSERATSNPELALVGFHSTFNILGTVLCIPVAGRFARLLERLVPDRITKVQESLNPALLSAPEFALPAAARCAEELTHSLLSAVARRINTGDDSGLDSELEDGIRQLRSYLDGIATHPRQSELHHQHRDLIHATDHMSRLAERLSKGQIPLPDDSPQSQLAQRVAATMASDDASALTRSFHDFAKAEGQLREETIERVARDELDATDAIRQLESGRALRRALHHAYRIRYRLAGSDPADLVHEDDGNHGD